MTKIKIASIWGVLSFCALAGSAQAANTGYEQVEVIGVTTASDEFAFWLAAGPDNQCGGRKYYMPMVDASDDTIAKIVLAAYLAGKRVRVSYYDTAADCKSGGARLSYVKIQD